MGRRETIEVEGQPMTAYLAVPDGDGVAPGVLVNMHGPGVDRFLEDRVDDLARHGYVAIAPDLYHRQPDDGSDTMAKVARVRDHEILADTDAAVAHLARLADARVGALATLGFCMGGRTTYLLAGARPTQWRAAGVFYGGNVFKARGDGPSPFERTAQIACPLIGFFGDDDANPSPADVDRIDAELTAHGKAHQFHRYRGAGHAFLNFTNAERHRPTQAADAWRRMLAFLDEHLQPSGKRAP